MAISSPSSRMSKPTTPSKIRTGLLKKIYEKTINVAAELLKNTPRGEVATKADLSGPLDNPEASTWQMVLTLLQNAFFDAVLPGLEGGLPKK
jgi:hypothetical protein